MRCKHCKRPIEQFDGHSWVHKYGAQVHSAVRDTHVIEPEPTPESKEPTPSADGVHSLRSSYYQTSDGVSQLVSLAKRIEDADYWFHYRVMVLEAALEHLKAHIDDKYNWD